MDRRTRRYNNDNSKQQISSGRRTDKNKSLYDDVSNIIEVDNISNLDTQTKIDLSMISSYSKSREQYAKLKDYKELFESTDKKVEEEQQQPYEKKVYDINSVLEEAKKNRIKYDELEKKRKLRENTYATMADINDIKNLKEKRPSNNIDEEELTNLINTITSHNLLDEIKKAEEAESNSDNDEEILSELLATNVDLNLEKGIAEEFTGVDNAEKIDNSFYTKSMDLSDQDFEFEEEFERDRKTVIKIVLLVSIIVAIIGVVAFVILKKKGII